MMKVMKQHGKIQQAYRLGQSHPVLAELTEKNLLADLGNGCYEVFSQEAVKGGSGHGQLARAGDWVRIDGAGYPYPSTDSWFREHMRHLAGDDYEQIPTPLDAWRADLPMCPEVRFLTEHKGLILDPENPRRYFRAVLWGTAEAADRDAVLVFYSICRDDAGRITDAEFNFVEKQEFDRTYRILSE